MADSDINTWGPMMLGAINAANSARLTLEELIDDSGMQPDEDSMAAVEKGKADEEAALAYLQANAPKCPACKQAFAFQRQKNAPSRCNWCGYDHDTGERPGLVPA